MTLEKTKRIHFAEKDAVVFAQAIAGHRMCRREARRLIRLERKQTRQFIREGKITNRTRFLCNHCHTPLQPDQWLWASGAVIWCPKCHNWIMDIYSTRRIEV